MYMRDYGIELEYGTVEEMVRKARPEIVSVCVWHKLHAPVTVAVAKAGGVKGIICEKPMATSLAEADAMIDACESNGVKLVISHQRRFTPGWVKARELVAQGAIGKPYTVDVRVAEGLLNWATHTIDGGRFVLGDPMPVWVVGAVERRTDRFERDTPIEDSCIGLVHFEGDVQFTIQSDLYREGSDAGKFIVRGSEGMLHVEEMKVGLFNARTGGWHDVPLNAAKEAKAIGGATNAAQAEELIRWIEGGPVHRGAARSARVTLEIMMAVYESARTHHVIRLPLQEKGYPLELMIKEGKLPVEVPGRYDIRGFLKRDGIDEAEYARLRSQGVAHHQAMRMVHEGAQKRHK
jgi:predicted dehydrogenase